MNQVQNQKAASRLRGRLAPVVIVACAAVVLLAGAFMTVRADRQVNHVSLASEPKGVTVVSARSALYRPTRKYVGTIEPWIEARLGPQLVSAYVDTVLVRPGDAVRRGQVVATLDCRNASAASRAVSLQARALQASQEALAHEASRIAELEQGGFASPNEIENKRAESISKAAELESTKARLQRATLEVSDCVLRAPFAGEISARLADPGAFVHPGEHVAAIVDRATVRVTAQVPEADFDVVSPGTAVRIVALANGRELAGKIARRSPAADASTRTVHFEIDIPDPDHRLPVGTTAELSIDVGDPVQATEVPALAASVRGSQATVYLVSGDVARRRVCQVLGERGSSVFLDSSLAAGADVVTEGRALLHDGDRVRVARAVAHGETR